MKEDNPPRGPWSDRDFRLIFGRTKIDYDWIKEASNRKKHDYSLESVIYFFEGMLLPLGRPIIATSDPIDCEGELRYQHLTIDTSGNVVFFVTTMRADETVRVISFRRASPEEEVIYREACRHGHIRVPEK
ncbi:MAG: BrnT family toxin [Pseudomonadota bacterium]